MGDYKNGRVQRRLENIIKGGNTVRTSIYLCLLFLVFYFFAAAASSALAFARFALTPTSLASLRAILILRYAFSSPFGRSDFLISEMAFSRAGLVTGRTELMLLARPSLAALISSAEESSFLN